MANEIYVYDEIGPSFYGLVDGKVVAEALQSFGGGDVTVRVNSPGGDVFEGLAITELLRGYNGGKVTMQVDSLAASAATLLVAGVDDVVMAPSAYFVTHDPWTVTIGNMAQHAATVDVLAKMRETVLDLYQGKVGDRLTRDTLRNYLDQDEVWLNAADAVDQGFADMIRGSDEGRVAANLGRYAKLFNAVPDALRQNEKTGEAGRVQKAREKVRGHAANLTRHKIDVLRP